MPMIDVYAAAGTCADEQQLAVDLASAVMNVDGGWGLGGHAYTNTELVQAARAQLAGGPPRTGN
jgi:hypothetical protein